MRGMKTATIRCLALLLLLMVPAVGDENAPKWDRRKEKAATEFATRWWQARPKTRFIEWDEAARKELQAEAETFGEIPEGQLEDVVEALWKPVRKVGPKHARDNSIETPYGKATFILNDHLIDPAKEVVVMSNGAELYRGRPVPDYWTVLETLSARMDRKMVFDRRIER